MSAASAKASIVFGADERPTEIRCVIENTVAPRRSRPATLAPPGAELSRGEADRTGALEASGGRSCSPRRGPPVGIEATASPATHGVARG